MPAKKPTSRKPRTPIRGKNWKRTPTIATDKYQTMSAAILSTLTSKPIAFYDMVKRISKKLKSFDGSIPWYAITCLRELETQGKIKRHTKPVRYSKSTLPAP